jgi:hypothetical protein
MRQGIFISKKARLGQAKGWLTLTMKLSPLGPHTTISLYWSSSSMLLKRGRMAKDVGSAAPQRSAGPLQTDSLVELLHKFACSTSLSSRLWRCTGPGWTSFISWSPQKRRKLARWCVRSTCTVLAIDQYVDSRRASSCSPSCTTSSCGRGSAHSGRWRRSCEAEALAVELRFEGSVRLSRCAPWRVVSLIVHYRSLCFLACFCVKLATPSANVDVLLCGSNRVRKLELWRLLAIPKHPPFSPRLYRTLSKTRLRWQYYSRSQLQIEGESLME